MVQKKIAKWIPRYTRVRTNSFKGIVGTASVGPSTKISWESKQPNARRDAFVSCRPTSRKFWAPFLLWMVVCSHADAGSVSALALGSPISISIEVQT